jgi:hypothetical protein
MTFIVVANMEITSVIDRKRVEHSDVAVVPIVYHLDMPRTLPAGGWPIDEETDEPNQ